MISDDDKTWTMIRETINKTRRNWLIEETFLQAMSMLVSEEPAQTLIAAMWLHEIIFKRNGDTVEDRYYKGRACFELGLLYCTGVTDVISVEKDVVEWRFIIERDPFRAADLFRLAIRFGYYSAVNSLAETYMMCGVFSMEARLYRASVEYGFNPENAQKALDSMVERGVIQQEDIPEHVEIPTGENVFEFYTMEENEVIN